MTWEKSLQWNRFSWNHFHVLRAVDRRLELAKLSFDLRNETTIYLAMLYIRRVRTSLSKFDVILHHLKNYYFCVFLQDLQVFQVTGVTGCHLINLTTNTNTTTISQSHHPRLNIPYFESNNSFCYSLRPFRFFLLAVWL